MNSQMIFMDPKIEQVNGYFPNLYDLKIRSNGEEVIGTMLTPGEEGSCPTAILLHGFPGYEDNHDLAHRLR